ncbi:hypothetical protein EVAR_20897_1 [Eumeta japonica]|uniref:Uncharacterized protein n=1 Tax=Eumeta variegata TaxID=151549 RepID=A0A4C1UXF6_EUMVA|nr:hypothetical protein EVAR_20897_1 [Eumeta japonica]
MSNNICSLSFTASGLGKNVPELEKCMSEQSIDIAHTQETYLKPSRPKSCSIAGYVKQCKITNRQDARTVVEKSEREIPTSSDRRKLPPHILKLVREKNAALRRASASLTPEYRSTARALQREKVTKAFKTERYIPIPPLKRPDNSVAIDDAKIAECLADSIKTKRFPSA